MSLRTFDSFEYVVKYLFKSKSGIESADEILHSLNMYNEGRIKNVVVRVKYDNSIKYEKSISSLLKDSGFITVPSSPSNINSSISAKNDENDLKICTAQWKLDLSSLQHPKEIISKYISLIEATKRKKGEEDSDLLFSHSAGSNAESFKRLKEEKNNTKFTFRPHFDEELKEESRNDKSIPRLHIPQQQHRFKKIPEQKSNTFQQQKQQQKQSKYSPQEYFIPSIGEPMNKNEVVKLLHKLRVEKNNPNLPIYKIEETAESIKNFDDACLNGTAASIETMRKACIEAGVKPSFYNKLMNVIDKAGDEFLSLPNIGKNHGGWSKFSDLIANSADYVDKIDQIFEEMIISEHGEKHLPKRPSATQMGFDIANMWADDVQDTINKFKEFSPTANIDIMNIGSSAFKKAFPNVSSASVEEIRGKMDGDEKGSVQSEAERLLGLDPNLRDVEDLPNERLEMIMSYIDSDLGKHRNNGHLNSVVEELTTILLNDGLMTDADKRMYLSYAEQCTKRINGMDLSFIREDDNKRRILKSQINNNNNNIGSGMNIAAHGDEDPEVAESLRKSAMREEALRKIKDYGWKAQLTEAVVWSIVAVFFGFRAYSSVQSAWSDKDIEESIRRSTRGKPVSKTPGGVPAPKNPPNGGSDSADNDAQVATVPGQDSSRIVVHSPDGTSPMDDGDDSTALATTTQANGVVIRGDTDITASLVREAEKQEEERIEEFMSENEVLFHNIDVTAKSVEKISGRKFFNTNTGREEYAYDHMLMKGGVVNINNMKQIPINLYNQDVVEYKRATEKLNDKIEEYKKAILDYGNHATEVDRAREEIKKCQEAIENINKAIEEYGLIAKSEGGRRIWDETYNALATGQKRMYDTWVTQMPKECHNNIGYSAECKAVFDSMAKVTLNPSSVVQGAIDTPEGSNSLIQVVEKYKGEDALKTTEQIDEFIDDLSNAAAVSHMSKFSDELITKWESNQEDLKKIKDYIKGWIQVKLTAQQATYAHGSALAQAFYHLSSNMTTMNQLIDTKELKEQNMMKMFVSLLKSHKNTYDQLYEDYQKKGDDLIQSFVAWKATEEFFGACLLQNLNQKQAESISSKLEGDSPELLSRKKLEMDFRVAAQLAKLKGWVKSEDDIPSVRLQQYWYQMGQSSDTGILGTLRRWLTSGILGRFLFNLLINVTIGKMSDEVCELATSMYDAHDTLVTGVVKENVYWILGPLLKRFVKFIITMLTQWKMYQYFGEAASLAADTWAYLASNTLNICKEWSDQIYNDKRFGGWARTGLSFVVKYGLGYGGLITFTIPRMVFGIFGKIYDIFPQMTEGRKMRIQISILGVTIAAVVVILFCLVPVSSVQAAFTYIGHTFANFQQNLCALIPNSWDDLSIKTKIWSRIILQGFSTVVETAAETSIETYKSYWSYPNEIYWRTVLYIVPFGDKIYENYIKGSNVFMAVSSLGVGVGSIVVAGLMVGAYKLGSNASAYIEQQFWPWKYISVPAGLAAKTVEACWELIKRLIRPVYSVYQQMLHSVIHRRIHPKDPLRDRKIEAFKYIGQYTAAMLCGSFFNYLMTDRTFSSQDDISRQPLQWNQSIPRPEFIKDLSNVPNGTTSPIDQINPFMSGEENSLTLWGALTLVFNRKANAILDGFRNASGRYIDINALTKEIIEKQKIGSVTAISLLNLLQSYKDSRGVPLSKDLILEIVNCVEKGECSSN